MRTELSKRRKSRKADKERDCGTHEIASCVFFYLQYTPWGYIMDTGGKNKMRDERECCHKTKERTEKEYKDLINRDRKSVV